MTEMIKQAQLHWVQFVLKIIKPSILNFLVGFFLEPYDDEAGHDQN